MDNAELFTIMTISTWAQRHSAFNQQQLESSYISFSVVGQIFTIFHATSNGRCHFKPPASLKKPCILCFGKHQTLRKELRSVGRKFCWLMRKQPHCAKERWSSRQNKCSFIQRSAIFMLPQPVTACAILCQPLRVAL